ncbi:MAG: hypothetical protein CL896_02095 [Dehalococcoidia bacterium]|nr:hypothetical protein [Dehalococcoidia bacterium]
MLSSKSSNRVSLFSWVLYDVGNTIFFTGIVGLFFPLWVVTEMEGTDSDYGFTLSASMFVVLLIAPFVGAVCDRVRNLKYGVSACTLIAVVAIFLAGFNIEILLVGLVLFGVSFIFMNMAEIFYNSGLSLISTNQNIGRIGGIAIGIGYIGALVAVLIGVVGVEHYGYDYGLSFQIIAGFILLVSIPMSIFFKDQQKLSSKHSFPAIGLATLRQFFAGVRYIFRSPSIRIFMVARFWYMWAIGVGSSFVALYGLDTLGLTSFQIEMILLVGVIFAMPFGMLWGVLVDRLGSKLCLQLVLTGWAIVFLLAIMVPLFNWSTEIWWLFGILVGCLYGGLWTADRPLLISLSPEGFLGESFGFYSLMARFAYLVGTFVWAILSDTFAQGQIMAVGTLFLSTLIGLACVCMISNTGTRVINK